jgi:hypothetical protein
MSSQNTTEVFNNAFLAATPDIAAELVDLTYNMPMWLADIWELKKWTATDNVMQQLTYKGSMPEIERGFNLWKQLAASSGCEPCTNDCSYNTTTFHGGGLNRQLVSLMRREFVTQPFCVNEIKSTEEYEMMFGKIVENIQRQTAYFKEMNIGQNYLTGIAKKIMVDSGGIKGNSADPYSYRPLGTATLSKLNLALVSNIYEKMRRRAEIQPFDRVNGRPLYAMSASDEVMDALFVQDPGSRQDLRFSSANDAVLTRYNFMYSIRSQFINAPLDYPRRFDYVSSAWVERLPYVNGIPDEIGEHSDLNPLWEAAAYEEVLFYGKAPFTVYYRDQVTTVGSGTDFGPEPSFMNQWLWINNRTDNDWLRRSGFFGTSIEIALAAQHSQVYGLMVPRPSQSMIAEFFPAAVCPPDSVSCDNEVPAITTCPCPLVLSATADPFNAARYTIVFGVPIDAVPTDPIQLGLATGGYINGTVSAITADGLTLSVQFATGTVIDNCAGLTAVFCDNTLGCSSLVTLASDCRSGETGDFVVVLQNPIKADTAADIVYGLMGDGTTQHFSVVSVDMMTNTWVLEYAAGYGPSDDPTGAGATNLNADIVCDRNGIISICVPTATDATCGACGSGPVVTVCSES